MWDSLSVTRWLYRLGHACAVRGRLVIAAWVVAVLMIMGANSLIPGASVESFSLQGTDSTTAQELLGRAFPGTSTEANPLVLSSDTLRLGEGVGEAAVDSIADAVGALPVVSSVTTPSDQPSLLAEDGTTAIVQVVVNDQSIGRDDVAAEVFDTAKAAAPPDITVYIGGTLGTQLSTPDTRSSEAVGLLVALVVLFFAMRRAWAVALPLINAIVAVGAGLAIIGLLGRVVFIPDVAPTLGTMLGLGVGIDYALFLVTRHRKLLVQGYSVPDAVGRTAGTAGAGMVFAGGTLIAAVVGLTLTGISFLAWLGYAAAIVVAIAVFASLTLLPAMLGVLGHRVMPKKTHLVDEHDHEELDKSWWARLATAVTDKPWTFAISSTVLLLVLAAPTLSLELGHSDASDLPESTVSRQAYDAAAAGFGPGTTAPLAVVSQMYTIATAPEGVTGPGDPRTQDPRLTTLAVDLAATPGVVRVDSPVVSTDGGVAVIQVIPEWNSADPQTAELVERLRTDVIPEATAGKGMTSYVGGVTALTTDLSELIASRTVGFIVGVVVLSFILLMLAYRSLLIPFKAAMMNLISIAAAYGVVTAVFQWGWGAHLIGVDAPVPIESYVPMMMFAVLFGLSMDYEVFLLTAFREHWERCGDMHIAVRRGLADTGRLVTSAALIMVAVFGSFILSDNTTVKIFGVGLATAVLVDASIVRCLLVPAIMVLAAKGTWWLPGWLDRLLPQLHVEGDPTALSGAAASNSSQTRLGRPAILHRPVLVIGTVLGAFLAWVLVSRLPGLPFDASTAIAMSAVLGGVAVLLPSAATGESGNRPTRALGYTIGVLLGLVVIGILSLFIPPVPADGGAITAWAIVLVSLLAVLVVGRTLALPMLLGAISTALALGLLAATSPDSLTLILVTLVPALTTVMVASIVVGIVSPPENNVDVPPEGNEPRDRELATAGGRHNEELIPMIDVDDHGPDTPRGHS